MSATPPEVRHGLPRAARLRTRRHFQRVYRRGARASGDWLTVVACGTRAGTGTRLGVSVSKANGAAVRRNKLKRLLREAFRLERHALPADLDLVLIPRPVEGHWSLPDLRAELVRLCQRIAAGRGRPNVRKGET